MQNFKTIWEPRNKLWTTQFSPDLSLRYVSRAEELYCHSSVVLFNNIPPAWHRVREILIACHWINTDKLHHCNTTSFCYQYVVSFYFEVRTFWSLLHWIYFHKNIEILCMCIFQLWQGTSSGDPSRRRVTTLSSWAINVKAADCVARTSATRVIVAENFGCNTRRVEIDTGIPYVQTRRSYYRPISATGIWGWSWGI